MAVSVGLAGTPFADNPASPWGNAPPAIASWLTENWGLPGFDTATVGAGLGSTAGTTAGSTAGTSASTLPYGGLVPMGGGSPATPAGWSPPTKSASWKPGMSTVPTRQLLSGRVPVGGTFNPLTPGLPGAPPSLTNNAVTSNALTNMNNAAPPNSLIAAILAQLGQNAATGLPMGVRAPQAGTGALAGQAQVVPQPAGAHLASMQGIQ